MRTEFVAVPLCLVLFSASAVAGGIAANVGISGFTYTPAALTIEAGETVAFAASALHPLAFEDNPDVACNVACNIVFRTPGEYRFYCENHGAPGSGMAGILTVTASSIEDRLFLDPFERSYD